MNGRAGSQRLLIVAAVMLAVVGLVLVFTGSGGDGGSSGSAGVTAQPNGSDDTTPDGDGSAPGGDGAGDTPADGTSTADTDAPDRPGAGTGSEPAEPDDHDEPLAPSDTPTAAQTPAPRQTPTLPPGMRLPEPAEVPDPATVDGNDPTAVVAAALTAAYSFDTAHDTSARDAMTRAQAWLTDEYSSSSYDLEGLEQDVQRDWPVWSEHQAFASISSVEPQTTDVDTPDTATRAERRFYVRMTPVGRDAWNGALTVHQWFAFLTRDSAADPWKIVELQTPLAHR